MPDWFLLYKVAEPTPSLEAAAQLHRHPSNYPALPDLELTTEARNLSQRPPPANKAALLKDYNLTAADLTALPTDAQTFGAQLAIDTSNI